jgi:hypothetical protein
MLLFVQSFVLNYTLWAALCWCILAKLKMDWDFYPGQQATAAETNGSHLVLCIGKKLW